MAKRTAAQLRHSKPYKKGPRKTYSGRFRPKNPSKYKGDPTKIIYRSSWECKLMFHLDKHDEVLAWSSEEIVIPYISPVDGKVHRYFPDFYVKKRDKEGNISEMLIEVKPEKETRPPKTPKKQTARYLTEVKTWSVNSAKWKAAEAYCKKRGWTFAKFTEKHLGV